MKDTKDRLQNSMLVYEYSEVMQHDKWRDEIPYINFPPEWSIQISPPFSGAVVRFRVKCGNADVSVYLDCYDRLGFVGEPYWEIYPHQGDCFRCLMSETNKLLQAIRESIEQEDSV